MGPVPLLTNNTPSKAVDPGLNVIFLIYVRVNPRQCGVQECGTFLRTPAHAGSGRSNCIIITG